MSVRRSLRTRLFAAFVVMALGLLVASSVATYVLVRRAIEREALDDMRDRAGQLAELAGDFRVQLPQDDPETRDVNEFRVAVDRLRGLGRALELASVVAVVMGPDGELVQPPFLERSGERLDLPRGVELDDIDTEAVLAGDESTGRRGELVFLAQPVRDTQLGLLVLVATDTIDLSVLDRALPLLLVAVAVLLALAAVVSAWLARRLLRPVRAIEVAARDLAAGDLTARASLPKGTDEEMRALARTLNALAARLEDRRDADRAFLMSVSHDLRTPLTAIRGYAEALADGTVDGAEGRARAAGIIQAETRRLERLVRDLLDLARLDAHEYSLTPQPCDAAAVVRDAAEAFLPAAHDIGVELAVDAREPVRADVDPDRLGQVVANLVENALKFARARIDVEVHAAPGELELLVTDDGPGIADSEVERVFERLYTARGTPGRSVGTGLGLAIVGELAGAMGGSARVEKPSGGGVRFVVTLPIGPSASV